MRSAQDTDPNINFTRAWGRRRFRTWWRYLHHLAGQPLAMLEIGVLEGYTGCWFLDHILTHPDSRYTAIDSWEPENNTTDHFSPDGVTLIREIRARRNFARYAPKTSVLKGRSTTVLRQRFIPVPTYDIIYVDGDHSWHGELSDIVMCWALLGFGGYMLIDDLHFKAKEPDKDRVDKLLGWFLTCIPGQYKLLHRDAVAVLRKL
jgi:predicted O-methyltransferase YrrM